MKIDDFVPILHEKAKKCGHKGEYVVDLWVEVKCGHCGVIVEKVKWSKFIKKAREYEEG